MGEAFILEGSADAAVFEIYIEQILAPNLQAGSIVILDNLSTHFGEKVRHAIEVRECQLLFLPSYSPDLSPIEEAFSKLKAFLRRVGARTPETDAGRQLRKRSSPLPHRMLWDGLCIVGIAQIHVSGLLQTALRGEEHTLVRSVSFDT